ncbi:unnamed protein product [Symbiodinium sp. CCMP2592]|nr:unnamed protein product [Symbiodinium sp. CCMP2592]
MPEVHLTIASALLAAGDQDLSASDRTDCNKSRLKELLDSPCSFGRCRSGHCSVCEPGLKLEDVLAFRRVFDGMGSARRAAFLNRSYGDAKAGNTRCKRIFLEKRCCERQLFALLEISASTLGKLCKGHCFDGRVTNGRMVTEAGMSVDQFFLEMYHSAAEFLPEDDTCHMENVDWTVQQEELQESQAPDLGRDDEDLAPMLGWDPEKSWLHTAIASAADAHLPKRYVQHKKPIDIWWLYLAWRLVRVPESQSADSESRAACWSTFWQRWSKRWCHCIGLRKPTQHAQCNDCSKFSNLLHFGDASVAEKKAVVQQGAWIKHSLHNPGWHGQECSWPQLPFRKPKNLEKFHRPRLTIHLALAHGFCADFYLADDENFFHGASFFCEILTRTLARVQEACRQQGRSMPDHLVIQSDNTTAQAKNAEVANFLGVLVRKFKFQSCVLNFLRVGHTLEDVDFVFSILLAKVLRRCKVMVPEDLRTGILTGMTPVLAPKGYDVNVEILTHVRNFQSWLGAMCVHPHNCYKRREGILAPHSFTFKLRMDLAPREQQLLLQHPTDRGWPSNPLDVFCVVKTWMQSHGPNGPPTLLIPDARFDRISTAAPTEACRASHPMRQQRTKELRQLADALEELTGTWKAEHSMFRSAQELRDLADGRNREPSQDGYLEALEAPRDDPIVEAA